MTTLNPLKFYLVPMRPAVAFEATVSATPTDPYMSIDFSGATATGTAPPLAGMTAYFEASDGTARGDARVRSVPTGTASGTLSVAENDDVTPFVQSGDTVRIYTEFRLWPIYPRFTQDGTNVTQYEDYDIAYSDQLTNYIPTAVAGPPGAAFLSGGQAQVNFVGDRSFTIDPSASISTYYWRAYGSVEADNSAQGTEASPVTFTWTGDGIYLVSLTVTDSNGKSHTAYTYAVIIDPDNIGNIAFTNFDAAGEKFDFAQGGGECSFTIREADISPTQFPDEMAILHIAQGNLTTPTASWPNRNNLLFWGWVMGDSVRQSPDSGEVAFRAGTIDRVMRNLSQFPVSLTNNSNPVAWIQAKNLTVDRVCHYVYNYRSTLALMTPLRPLNYSGLIGRQDFGNQDLYSAVQSGLMQSVWSYLTASPQGVLYHEIDYNLQNSTERSAATTRKTLHKGVWAGDVGIEEIHDYSWVANQVKMSGIAYTGGDYDDVCPLFSEAPGDAPRAWGRESSVDRLILTSQSDLNVRCGHKLAQLDNKYPSVRASFLNDGAFANVPQDLFPLIIESADNDRQIAINQNALARSVGRQYDHQNGLIQVDVTFELVTTGNPGVTVDMPCEPPAQDLPDPSTGAIVNTAPFTFSPELSGAAFGTTGTSFYFAPGVPASWEERVSGLASNQLAFYDMVRDPFSAVIRGGYSAGESILWGCGPGFIVRTEDSGRSWRTRSNNIPDAEYPGDSAVSAADIDFITIAPNDFSQNHLYLLGRWQNGGNWRGGILQTLDGFNYTWTYLTGNSQVQPLGMAIDRGFGVRLWVTTWESDNKIYLRRLELTAVNQSLKVDLGSATEAQVFAQTYWAHPSCAYGYANQVFVFGRMQNPQSLGDPSHVIKSDDLGSSWSQIEGSWGNDLCEIFVSDINGFYYATRRDVS